MISVFNKNKKVFCYALFLLVGVTIAVSVYFFILKNPKNALLVERNGSQWIYYKKPFYLGIQTSKHLTTVFRKSFRLFQYNKEMIFSFSAMKDVEIRLDNNSLFSSGSLPKHNWKNEFFVTLPDNLEIGDHVLTVMVGNTFGPPAFIGYCDNVSLKTNEQWEASLDGLNWTPAITIDTYLAPNDCAIKSLNVLPLSERFVLADKVIVQHIAFIISFFMASLTTCYFCCRNNKSLSKILPFMTIKRLSILLWLLWIVLSINNMRKLNLSIGMDAKAHYEYIVFMAKNWRVPLAHEGWQMFQPPLYYFISALLYKFLLNFTNQENSFYLLRLIPLLCGTLQIEICRRMVRYAFPDRRDLQLIGLTVGSLLPMNIYMSQYVGNEPLCALFSSIAILHAIKFISLYPQNSKKICAYIGLSIGLAILSKVTGILLLPIILMLFFCKVFTDKDNIIYKIRLLVQYGVIFLGTVSIISGWYYVWNFLKMGSFFIGGWDNNRGIQWWQHPGFRTPEQFMTFGYSLFNPVYSAVRGFWDSLYSTLWMDGFLSGKCSFDSRPKWNYSFLFVTIWLSLVMIIAGICSFFMSIKKMWSKKSEVMIFCITCIFVYLAAIAYLYLNVPIYSTAKASYMLGLVGAIAILCTDGLHYLMINKTLQITVYAFIVCWSFYSYFGYFIFL